MNEKIKQFAIFSGSTHKQNLGVYQFYTDELQNFSELLILDILNVFIYEMWKHGIDESNNPAFYKVIDKVKQNFSLHHQYNSAQLEIKS